jgi:hypothetical protein
VKSWTNAAPVKSEYQLSQDNKFSPNNSVRFYHPEQYDQHSEIVQMAW